MNKPGELVGYPDASGRVGAAHPSPTIEGSESALKMNLCVRLLYILQGFVETPNNQSRFISLSESAIGALADLAIGDIKISDGLRYVATVRQCVS